jgi:hypothetical protein
MPQPSEAVIAAPPGPAPGQFQFFTSLVLVESTGLRASTLPVLVRLLREVPESCIYHHTHHFLLQHHYLSPEPSNDFAYWVREVLGEEELGERLANIDITEHTSLASLRQSIVGAIDDYLKQTPTARLKFVSEGQEFFLNKSVHVVMPTPYSASTLEEFAGVLEHVSVRSLYFHLFEARLRLKQADNDFSMWFRNQLSKGELAEDVSHLDLYAHTLDTLRGILLSLIREELRK